MLAALFFWAMVSGAASQPPKNQVDEYHARTPKTVIELQQFRKSASIAIRKNTGQAGTATLINLNPRINTWYLLLIQRRDSDPVEAYHLENPAPETQKLLLDPDFTEGIV
ncbi:MAG: hypothetical protein E4H15_09040, partial [Syntrophobacterales bacterium]